LTNLKQNSLDENVHEIDEGRVTRVGNLKTAHHERHRLDKYHRFRERIAMDPLDGPFSPRLPPFFVRERGDVARDDDDGDRYRFLDPVYSRNTSTSRNARADTRQNRVRDDGIYIPPPRREFAVIAAAEAIKMSFEERFGFYDRRV